MYVLWDTQFRKHRRPEGIKDWEGSIPASGGGNAPHGNQNR